MVILALAAVAFVILTAVNRAPVAFLLTLGGLIYCLASGAPASPPVAPEAQAAPAAVRRPLIIAPEPDPASQGILLDQWARAAAPLTPLN